MMSPLMEMQALSPLINSETRIEAEEFDATADTEIQYPDNRNRYMTRTNKNQFSYEGN